MGATGLAESFRDPGGVVIHWGDDVFRFTSAPAGEFLSAFLDSELGKQLLQAGKVVPTSTLKQDAISQVPGLIAHLQDLGMKCEYAFQHEKIDFPSYPTEWPAEMLHSAGLLTLELAEMALQSGMGLKDATPFNIMFQGTKPVFVDLLSFEPREGRDGRWLPQSQFIRTFLLPLLRFRIVGTAPHADFMHRRDGLEPEQVLPHLSWVDRFSPIALMNVTLPLFLNRFAASGKVYESTLLSSNEHANYVLRSSFGRLRRDLRRVAPKPATSAWTDYEQQRVHYDDIHLEKKRGFVHECLNETNPKRVLDVGCNDGEFSLIAAQHDASVVAIDSDPAVVGQAWRNACANNADVLPLIVDIGHPTPATGWDNSECASFLQRAQKKFDLVMVLAVMHHLIVAERIPLQKLAAFFARLVKRWLIIEWVPKEDPKFQAILRGRASLFQEIDVARFEQEMKRFFAIRRCLDLANGGRRLYLLELSTPLSDGHA
jgi:SAM-dependent methyltransferase